MIPSIAVRRPDDGVKRTNPWGAFWRDPRLPKGKDRQSRYFPTEADALAFRDELVAQFKQKSADVDTTTTIATKTGTIGRYLVDWLAIMLTARTAATYKSYEQAVRLYIVPTVIDRGVRFGDVRMGDLKRMHVKKLMAALLAAGSSFARRTHTHAVLSSACGSAVLDEELDYNPCDQIGKTIRQKDEYDADPEPNPFTPEQSAAFLNYARKHEEDWYDYFRFLDATGIRVGEAAALKWEAKNRKTGKVESRFDLTGNPARVQIAESFSYAERTAAKKAGRDGGDKDTKNHLCRWVDLADDVAKDLPALRARQRTDLFRRGQSNAKQYVFTNGRGNPRRPDKTMRRAFGRIITNAKLTDGTPAFAPDAKHTPHDIRDTFATRHLCADIRTLPWVSVQLGHESPETTLRHYFKFLPSAVTKTYANKIR
jgi:integrase